MDLKTTRLSDRRHRLRYPEFMPRKCPHISSDPEILGGVPVFLGTRVPIKALLDYLEGGHSLTAFLDDFPTVSREQAIAVLEHAKLLLDYSASAA